MADEKVTEENPTEGEQGAPESAEARERARKATEWTREQVGQITALATSTVTALQRRGGGAARKAGQVVKDHPVATVAVVAGAAALLHAKVAAAALAGIGVTALFTRQTGPETRSQMNALVRRGRSWLAQRLSRLQSLVAPQPAETTGP
jgi:ElaB/YqjD/DUF883 family membrane-anchored ribosome-binding protein